MFLKLLKPKHVNRNLLSILQNRLFSIDTGQTVQQPISEVCKTRLLKVAIIGSPNAGKSTFINNLMDRKVCATSSKVHTTRGSAMAIFTEGDAQIAFLDTPGLVNEKEKKRFNLERSFIKGPKKSLHEADIIGVVHDISNVHTRGKLDIKIIKLLEYFKKKTSFLVLNKVDLLKSKRKLLDFVRILSENSLDGKPIATTKKLKEEILQEKENRGWPYFNQIFMVSALTGSGLEEVKNYLIDSTKPAEWLVPDEVWTDQPIETIIENTVRAKLLDFLPQEIPYQLKCSLELFEKDEINGKIITSVIVTSPSERIAKLVSGASDGKLKQITEAIQHDLQQTFQCFVRIQIVMDYPNKKM